MRNSGRGRIPVRAAGLAKAGGHVHCDGAKRVAFKKVHLAVLGLAEACGVCQDGLENGSEFASEPLISCSTSEVAVCCSSASFSSRVSRATSPFLSAEKK